MTIHTHRGHCQLCGAVQALDVGNSDVAKHGYTVGGGYFNGVCPGSDYPNLHVSRALADQEIAKARVRATRDDSQAALLSARLTDPAYVWSGAYKYVRPARVTVERASNYRQHGEYCPLHETEVVVAYAEATPEFQEKGRARAIMHLLDDAKMCREYAKNLEAQADKITGKVAPYLVADLRLNGWSVGDTVRIGGVKGYDAVIEAIEDKLYQQHGWRRHNSGGTMCPHARLTRPAVTEKRASAKVGGYVTREARPELTYWEPIRNLKRPKAKVEA